VLAIKIQSKWRGKLASLRYFRLPSRIVRFQAITRGNIARGDYNHTLRCCVILQAAARRNISMNNFRLMKLEKALRLALVVEYQERTSIELIQRCWRMFLRKKKEKNAALVIERFFLVIVSAIDEEVQLLQQNEKRNNIKKRVRFKFKRISGSPQSASSNSGQSTSSESYQSDGTGKVQAFSKMFARVTSLIMRLFARIFRYF
jgi:IQ calmodulin-binding motif